MEEVSKPVAEMSDNSKDIDKEGNEAGLRLMCWKDKAGL